LGNLEAGKDKFGVCACGLQLPPLMKPGVYGPDMGRLLYATNGLQPMYAIMNLSMEHDVIEYYHVGDDLYREVRVRGGCPPGAEYIHRNDPE
jgi:hypothetical protein